MVWSQIDETDSELHLLTQPRPVQGADSKVALAPSLGAVSRTTQMEYLPLSPQ